MRAVWVFLTGVGLTYCADATYVGRQACRPCHASKLDSFERTGHARALAEAPAGSPGEWAFGAGLKAITYVSQADHDHYIEHGLSYYPQRRAMGITPGHATAEDRRYRTFDPLATTLRCFRCHSTGPLNLTSNNKIQPSQPGIQCESCHGPGEAHVRSGGASGTILNPNQLDAVEMNNFCGTCHRKAEDISDWSNSWNVRHEPAYLSQSACFRSSFGKLSCLTCHNPHTPMTRLAADYDQRCSSCHPAVRHRTAIAGQTCVRCHMPQVPTNAQLTFTNHWIGVYDKLHPLVPVRRSAKPARGLPAGQPRPKLMAPLDPASFRSLYEQVLAEQERQFGEKHISVARAASDLGLYLKSVGEYYAAIAPLQKALAIDQASADPALAADQENLALVFGELGQHAEALRLLREAAAGTNPAVTARSLSVLARLDPANAESYYRKAIPAEEQASGREHPRVAVLLNNLALTLRERKDDRSAEVLFRRALAIQRNSMGPSNPALALTLNNLGSLLQSAGRVQEAELLERNALRILEQKLGPQTAELATTCTNLADLLWTKGARAEAAALYRRALGIDESVYGSEHPEVAGDLTNLGILLKESGQAAAASLLLRRAAAIYEKVFGPGSPQAAQARENLKSLGP